MKFCTKCGKEILDEAVICPHCGCVVDRSTFQEITNDEVSIGLCVVAALIPIFGVIYWPVNSKKAPKRARACGITAIVSWVVYAFILSLMGI